MLLTTEEYNALGFDGGGDNELCARAILRSQRMVDLLTDGKCTAYEKSAPNEAALGNLKQAIGAQAEQYLEIGTVQPLGKTVVGDFSYSADVDEISVASPLTMAILKLSGLFYRGVRSR